MENFSTVSSAASQGTSASDVISIMAGDQGTAEQAVYAPTAYTPECAREREELSRKLGARAKARRRALGMTPRDLASQIGGLKRNDIAGWEARFPRSYRVAEPHWEKALQVPVGWLRDASMETPSVVATISEAPLPFKLHSLPKGTVAYEIAQICLLAAMPERSFDNMTKQAGGGRDLPELTEYRQTTAHKRVLVDMLACRAGVFGHVFSSPSAVSRRFDRNVSAGSFGDVRMRQRMEKMSVSLAAFDELTHAASPYLPCRATVLDSHLHGLLGGAMSVIDVQRFAKSILGRDVFHIEVVGADEVVLDASVSAAELQTTRSAVTDLIRFKGAAQISIVARYLASAFSRPYNVAQTIRLCRCLGGFDWLCEDTGWFWLGQATVSNAKTTALKVLAAADRDVHVDEIRYGLQRAGVLPLRNKVSAEDTSASDRLDLPSEILKRLLTRCEELRCVGAERFALRSPINLSLCLTKLEHAALVAIRARGGQAQLADLVGDLTPAGHTTLRSSERLLRNSPIFLSLKGGGLAIRGVVSDPKNVGRTLDKKQAAKLGARAANRRDELGLTPAQVAVQIGNISAGLIVKLEERLYREPHVFEGKWEEVLRVPEGWLRDITVATPPVPGRTRRNTNDTLMAEPLEPGSIAHQIRTFFQTVISLESEGEPSATDRRHLDYMLLRVGVYGRDASRPQFIAERYGVDYHSVVGKLTQLRLSSRRIGYNFNSILSLLQEVSGRLPMRVSQLDEEFAARLGGQLSIEALSDFCSGYLGRDVITIDSLGSFRAVLPHHHAMFDFSAVKKVVRHMCTLVGGAQINAVAGVLSGEIGRNVLPGEALRWCRILDGFEWIDEKSGWFWMAKDVIEGARQTIQKVLAVAPGEVDVADLRGAILAGRVDRQEHSAYYFPEMPHEVFVQFLTSLPELRRCDGRLAFTAGAPIVLEEALATWELRLYYVFKHGGGIQSRSALLQAMSTEGSVKKAAIDALLIRSPLIVSLERGVYRMRGFPIDAQAYARARGEALMTLSTRSTRKTTDVNQERSE